MLGRHRRRSSEVTPQHSKFRRQSPSQLLFSKKAFFYKMRLIKQTIERRTGAGSATLMPEEPEDMVRMSLKMKLLPLTKL